MSSKGLTIFPTNMPDINLKSFGPEFNDQAIVLDQPIDGLGYSDALKCSRVENLTVMADVVLSGSEDAVDVNNRCLNVTLTAKLWVLRGKLGFTVKGGSRGTTFIGRVDGRGKETDVDLGNWSDQSHDKTTNTHLNLWRADQSPVRVRVLHADTPSFEPGSGPYVYVFPSPKLGILHPIIVFGFMTLRRWGFFR